MNTRAVRGVLLAGLLFLVVHIGAVSLAPTFEAAGYQAVENPQNPTNSALYLGTILVVTALMLAAFKYDFDWAVRLVIVGSSGMLSWYVFSVFLPGTVAVAAAGLVAVVVLVVAGERVVADETLDADLVHDFTNSLEFALQWIARGEAAILPE